MKKMLTVCMVLVLVAGFCRLAGAADGKPAPGEILTAIDVAEMLKSGVGEAEIAQKMADQRGFDRAAARAKGTTDEMIIKELITSMKNDKKEIDSNKSIQYENQADQYFKDSHYDKAAKDYSLALYFSPDNYDLYKSRADTYKQYLTKKINMELNNNTTDTTKFITNKSNKIVCDAIYSDYNNATTLIKANQTMNKSDLNAQKYKMTQKEMKYDSTIEVQPYYNKSAQKTLDMRQLGKLRQSQRYANQANAEINKSMSEYHSLCGKAEDAPLPGSK